MAYLTQTGTPTLPLLTGVLLVILATVGCGRQSAASGGAAAAGQQPDLPATAERLDWRLDPGFELWSGRYRARTGPYYGVYEGSVVSKTYLFTQDDLTDITWFRDDEESGGQLRLTMYELVARLNIPVDHFDVTHVAEDRPGFTGAHWQLTAWSVPHEDHLAVSRGQDSRLALQSFPTAPARVPKNATLSSGPTPGLGEHWISPEDVPHGPIWVTVCGIPGVQGGRKVVGLMYMYSEAEMTGTSEGGLEKTNIPVGYVPFHVHFILAPPGFHGFDGRHWDVRIQFTSHEDHLRGGAFYRPPWEECPGG